MPVFLLARVAMMEGLHASASPAQLLRKVLRLGQTKPGPASGERCSCWFRLSKFVGILALSGQRRQVTRTAGLGPVRPNPAVDKLWPLHSPSVVLTGDRRNRTAIDPNVLKLSVAQRRQCVECSFLIVPAA